MSNIGDAERKTQNKVIRFFCDKLNYTYIGDLHDRENKNIDVNRLKAYLLERGYSERLADRAIDVLVRAAGNMQQGLYSANHNVYTLLKYGARVKENPGESEKAVYFIDFETPANNDFTLAEEVTIVGNNIKRPDIVIYINGIAIAVLELKKSTVSVSNGIRQNLTNQREHFIENFFTTVQLVLAGNDSEGLRYGAICTPEKYYLEWKEDGYRENMDERDETDIFIEEKCKSIDGKLEKQIFAMFYKKRLLDIIHNFIVFDKGIKKICRYNQYYGVKRAQKRLFERKKGGIIWHTQGSGKSLTMVWLSKWILANNPNARVLIVTDREELDENIEKTYTGVEEKIVRTKSGKDLINRLNSYEDRLICSLIHKFGKHGDEISDLDYDKYIEELYASLPAGFEAKGELYVFVDECHRTQSGKLHKAMKAILPKALFVGFTGTPLLKKDKNALDRTSSIAVFGGYIHTYKYDEGVRDGVVLDLRYEARNIPQDITSQERINAWFDAKTVGLMPRAKAKLKERWGNLQKVFSSRSRLEKIANDIIFDMETKPRLMNGNGNAILVADSIYSACKYYEIFQSKNFKKCAIITSYIPQPGDVRTETVSEDEETEAFEKYEAYLRMIGIDPHAEGAKEKVKKIVEDFETEAKRKFVEEPANMRLLIVVDKLLTGFDAPPCTYLYIDKKMHDHGLFQAICRVNRLDGEDKDFGYIIDYKELFGDLSEAMTNYTSGAFEDYDEEDIAEVLKNRIVEAKIYLNETLDALEELCEGVEPPRDELSYIRYFCGENGVDIGIDETFARSRERLYRLVSRLVRAYAEIKPDMSTAGYTQSEQANIAKKVEFYILLRETIGRASGDFIDLKQYEPGMRYLIDNYIAAEDSEIIGCLDDFTLLDFILAQESKLNGEEGNERSQESAAEAIENNIRKKIIEKQVVNPKYYANMSTVLEELIAERKKGVIAYKSMLDRYVELVKNITKPEENPAYPESIRHNGALRALYDNTGCDEALTIALHGAVMRSKLDGFRNNPVKENRIKKELFKILKDDSEVERLFKIIVEQEEY